MAPIEPLDLHARQWQFLSAPDAYLKANAVTGRLLAPESTRRQFVTAADILARLNVEVDKALKNPDIKEKFLSDGLEPMGGSAEAFAKFMRSEIDKYAKVIKAANIKLE